MIKYFLVPARIIQKRGRDWREPKYVASKRISWVGTYIESKDIYLIKANTPVQSKINFLKSKTDVVELDGTKEAKDKVKQKIGLEIKDSEDEINKIGRIQEPAFDKKNLKIIID